MSFNPLTPTHAAALRPFLVAALSGLWLAGCGGGKELAEAAPSAATASTRATTTTGVRLEGCVVDSLWLSAPGAVVHVRSADGRAIGAAFTDRHGVFQITVPANSGIVVDTAVGGQGGAVLDTGSTAVTLAGCLMTSA